MDGAVKTPGQLAFLEYNAYPSEELPYFSHMLICSAAPLEAENQFRREINKDLGSDADRHLWENNPLVGPFAGTRGPMSAKQEKRDQLHSQLATIGELFILDRLILVAADMPVWSITSGRSNYLASCLRRFNNTFLFVNEADMVLRLASTIANYFVFPSGTRMGGYRLGNLSIAGRGRGDDGYGRRPSDLRDLRLNGGLQAMPLCGEQMFRCEPWMGYPLDVIDCTDYTDSGRRYLSAFTASNALLRPFNYIATLVLMLLSPLGIGKIDSHGGYFRGRYCLDLLYELALRGVPSDKVRYHKLQAELKKHSISWITIPSDNSAPP